MNTKSFSWSVSSLIALGGLFLPAVAPAKPLYITVPKTYSPTESPIVEVAFAGQQPVELRVLEPSDLDAFLSSQASLRHAYEPPVLELNPGRYLSKGLNAVRQPGRFLLFALSKDLRDAVSPALPKRPENDPSGSGRPMSRLAEGAPKLVGVPPGMKLIRSEWLNLDLGGRSRDFSVPGFDEWGGEGQFEERRISLPPLPAGIYALQLVQGRIEGQVLLVISDLTVQVKQTDGEILVRVAGRDQRPRAGADVSVLLPGGGRGPLGKTDAHGEVRLPVDQPKILVKVASEKDVAVVDTDFYSALAIAPDVFVYGDRPIYRPGDVVQFRGVVRRPDGFLARLFRPRKRDVLVTLVPPEGKELTTKAQVDEFGSFAGKIQIPESLPTGVLRLLAKLDDHAHQSESRVQEYVKPTFYLELESEQDSVKPGETITAKVRARRYSGGVPEATAYEVFLYRTVLDTPAWVDDAGMGAQGSAVTYGSASTTEGVLSVPKRLYSSVSERLQQMRDAGESDSSKEEDPWSHAAKLDEKGEATVEVSVPPLEPGEERYPFKYTLTVRARDDQGTFANASRTYYLAESEVMGALSPSAKVVLVGGEPSLSVKALTLGGRSYGEAKGTVTWVLRGADEQEEPLKTDSIRTGPDGVWRGAAPAPKPGTLLARVVLEDKNGRPWTGETSLMLVGRGGEPVARVPVLTADAIGQVLEPDSTAQVVAMFPDGWGPGGRNAGPVWLTLSGTSLFETRELDVTGSTLVLSFEIERRFGSAVYASLAYPTAGGRWDERTVPFRIVPSERTLNVRVEPQLAEAPPLGRQTLSLRVTDHRGRGVEAQVSVGVVDKAVYAVQSEFRPGILDFFYPLVRNNVMSFYSAEFQGYGYGEQIAKLLRGTRPYEFAAIKPPTRKSKDQERDTAFWSPAIKTDREGTATVTFELPSNQTLWTVTAVAADADGRFGESTAEFATRGAMTVVAQLPQFLREGDEATASVRISRGTEGPASLGLDVALTPSAGTGEPAAKKLELPHGGEEVVQVALKAASAGKAGLSIAVKGGPSPLTDRREITVRPASIEETVVASAWGGGEIALPVAGDARVASLELRLSPSTVDAALTAAADLLTYPYGCLEQLVATTIPNVAVVRTLEKVGALDDLDAESRALLTEARSRAVQGTSRILDLAVKGGGFTWFSGYATPSPELTLIALDGLAYAIDAKLVDATDPRIVSSSAYLANLEGLPFDLDATRTYVLARLEGPRQAARARALLEQAQPGNPYALALSVLAAEHAGVGKEPALIDRVKTQVAASRDALGNVATWEPDPNVFWRYPLRKIGLSAIVAHAAAQGEVDVAPVRRRLIEALAKGSELSTFDKSTVLLHSLWLLERDAKAMRAMAEPAVEVSGGKMTSRLVRRGAGLVATLDPVARGVKVGSFEGVAALRARVETPLGSVQPLSEGMRIQRSYFVVRESGKQPLGVGDAVSQGEEVYVELSVDASGGDRERGQRSAYWVVEDAIPAGFEPLIEDKTFRGPPHNLPLAHEALKRRSLSPERAVFFFEEPAWWSDSPRVFGYVMRARFPGTFAAPPAIASDMYAASVRARTGSHTLRVQESKGAR